MAPISRGFGGRRRDGRADAAHAAGGADVLDQIAVVRSGRRSTARTGRVGNCRPACPHSSDQAQLNRAIAEVDEELAQRTADLAPALPKGSFGKASWLHRQRSDPFTT
jgi:hypothetical protein